VISDFCVLADPLCYFLGYFFKKIVQGCVPKKIMWSAATLSETLRHDAAHYEFEAAPGKLNWSVMKDKRDKYIIRLNNIYKSGLEKANVTILEGWASMVDAHTVAVNMNDGSSRQVTADHILIATGGKPMIPGGEGVAEHCITSDGFFALTEQPETVRRATGTKNSN